MVGTSGRLVGGDLDPDVGISPHDGGDPIEGARQPLADDADIEHPPLAILKWVARKRRHEISRDLIRASVEVLEPVS